MFEHIFVLKVNLEKSALSSINIDLDQFNGMIVDLDCNMLDWPIPYLGLALKGNLKVGVFWNPVIERVS